MFSYLAKLKIIHHISNIPCIKGANICFPAPIFTIFVKSNQW